MTFSNFNFVMSYTMYMSCPCTFFLGALDFRGTFLYAIWSSCILSKQHHIWLDMVAWWMGGAGSECVNTLHWAHLSWGWGWLADPKTVPAYYAVFHCCSFPISKWCTTTSAKSGSQCATSCQCGWQKKWIGMIWEWITWWGRLISK